MRWDELFADLEGQLEAGLSSKERDLQIEEKRLRIARLGLRDRLVGAASLGLPVAVQLVSGRNVPLLVRTVGKDWLAGDLVDRADGAQTIVALHALAGFVPTAQQLQASLDPAPSTALTDRLGIAYVLRDLARRRRTVCIQFLDGREATGTIDRVGRDHADLAEHPPGTPRRAGAVSRIRVLALERLAQVTPL